MQLLRTENVSPCSLLLVWRCRDSHSDQMRAGTRSHKNCCMSSVLWKWMVASVNVMNNTQLETLGGECLTSNSINHYDEFHVNLIFDRSIYDYRPMYRHGLLTIDRWFIFPKLWTVQLHLHKYRNKIKQKYILSKWKCRKFVFRHGREQENGLQIRSNQQSFFDLKQNSEKCFSSFI